MGNRTSQSDQDEEEVQPVLSNASSGIQSEDDGYGSVNGPVVTNGNTNGNAVSSSRNYILKTEQQTDETATIVRIPITPSHMQNARGDFVDSGEFQQDSERRALLQRIRYHGRLDPGPNSSLAIMPNHVVPRDYMISILLPVKGSQKSLITIFAMWNTMMGTSLLSMPWAILQAGFVCGILLLILVAFLMFYTSYLVLKSVKLEPGVEFNDFSDVCAHYLGKHSKKLAVVSSLATLFGGCIVYWILLSNFLYHIVVFIKNEVYHGSPGGGNHTNGSLFDVNSAYSDLYSNSSKHYSDVVCTPSDNSTVGGNGAFEAFWTLDLTVPLILAIPLFSLVNFKSTVIFTKINSFGVFSVMFLYIFTIVKAAGWGVHLDLGLAALPPQPDPSYASVFEWTFPALTGISALAYFLQNCVLTITRNQERPENNVRDLVIAYILVAVSYTFIGVLVYITFPLAKSCIQDNFLNNIAADDVMGFVAHIMLLMQMTCVFPLLIYIMRAQFLYDFFGSEWPSWKHVAVLNLCVFAACILFAIYLPHIGSIIGFVGAFCGLTYAIALPCLVHMRAQYVKGNLKWPSAIFHSTLIALGVANFVSQFVIIGKTV